MSAINEDEVSVPQLFGCSGEGFSSVPGIERDLCSSTLQSVKNLTIAWRLLGKLLPELLLRQLLEEVETGISDRGCVGPESGDLNHLLCVYPIPGTDLHQVPTAKLVDSAEQVGIPARGGPEQQPAVTQFPGKHHMIKNPR